MTIHHTMDTAKLNFKFTFFTFRPDLCLFANLQCQLYKLELSEDLIIVLLQRYLMKTIQ